MRICADLKRIQIIEEQLKEQIATLRLLHEETLGSENGITHMDDMEQAERAFIKGREALDEDIRTLTSMADVLREIRLKYQATEKRIVDRYNLDTVRYPETQFGTSRITGMETYQSLMPF